MPARRPAVEAELRVIALDLRNAAGLALTTAAVWDVRLPEASRRLPSCYEVLPAFMGGLRHPRGGGLRSF